MTRLVLLAALAAVASGTPRVFAFWYGWYGTPAQDGAWKHWDHGVLPSWRQEERALFPSEGVAFLPPHDIHAPFYPASGPYSSRNTTRVALQMQDMAAAGIGVAVVSWWGRVGVSTGDTQGVVNDLVPIVLEAAAAAGISVALHLEPYPGRCIDSIREDLVFLARYSAHSAMLSEGGRMVVFAYDSYHLQKEEWQTLLTPGGSKTVRGSELDVFVIGLWLDAQHGEEGAAAGFDGLYSYFASDGFSYGSSTANWGRMARFCEERGLLFGAWARS